jgi:hypothetical protein
VGQGLQQHVVEVLPGQVTVFEFQAGGEE